MPSGRPTMMSSARTFTPIGDYLADIVHCTCETHGTYAAPRKLHERGEAKCPACVLAAADAAARAEFAEARSATTRARRESLLGPLALPKRFAHATFDNFSIHGLPESAERAEQKVRKYAASFERWHAAGMNLVLVGGTGTGKTHLACALARAVEAKGYSVLFTEVARVARRFRDRIGRTDGPSESALMDAYTELDLLILDEIGVQKGSDAEIQLLTELVNARSAAVRPTVLISNLAPDGMERLLGERIMSRITARSPIIAFDWPDQRGARSAAPT